MGEIFEVTERWDLTDVWYRLGDSTSTFNICILSDVFTHWAPHKTMNISPTGKNVDTSDIESRNIVRNTQIPQIFWRIIQ